MKYKIELIDGLWCVFVNSRIIAACETKNEAREEIEKYRKHCIKKGQ